MSEKREIRELKAENARLQRMLDGLRANRNELAEARDKLCEALRRATLLRWCECGGLVSGGADHPCDSCGSTKGREFAAEVELVTLRDLHGQEVAALAARLREYRVALRKLVERAEDEYATEDCNCVTAGMMLEVAEARAVLGDEL